MNIKSKLLYSAAIAITTSTMSFSSHAFFNLNEVSNRDLRQITDSVKHKIALNGINNDILLVDDCLKILNKTSA